MLNTAPSNHHPEVSQLRRFHPLGELDYKFLTELAGKLTVQQAPAGTRLLAQGDSDDSLLYLLRGSLLLKAVDGGMQRISADDDSARSPIARLRPSRYDVVSSSNVAFLVVPSSLLTTTREPPPSGLDLYEVVEEAQNDTQVVSDQLAFQLYEDLRSNNLLLPSLPDVAVLVGRTINEEHADANHVARVIENDPVMATKLIKVANSARYAGRAAISNLPDAITRVGLSTTHSLVVTFALRELFRCTSPTLNRIMKNQWDEARQLAAICHVLASRCGNLHPETALLAGLVHNIGSVAVVAHARDYPGLTDNAEVLSEVIETLRSSLGKMILTYWDFPQSLIEAAADDPMRAHEGPCDLGDLVTVARHHVVSAEEDVLVEPGSTLPAYEKVALDPDTIETVLEEAHTQLEETMSLLNS